MKKLLVVFSLFFFQNGISQSVNNQKGKYVLAVHGGAGTIVKGQMTPAREKEYTDALSMALEKGSILLSQGGSALDAVEEVVKFLEDNPLFNAGKGAVFTSDGRHELDASIMDGSNLKAGAVAAVGTIKNPISAARAVMERSPHVMLSGAGAELFAREQGLTLVDPSYFHTEERRKGWQKINQKDSIKTRSKDSGIKSGGAGDENRIFPGEQLFGTVGAVALDRQGNLAAATSTGGMSNKRSGRIGDSPVIGAGTYANNQTAAISGTGWGEFFIRLVLAKTVSDMMEFGKMSLDEAAENMIMGRLPALGGDGGLIAVDKEGNIAMPFCTQGMYRGYVREGGQKIVQMYK